MALRKLHGPCRALAGSMRAAVRFECSCGAEVTMRRDTSTETEPTTTGCEACGSTYRLGLVVWHETAVRRAHD